MTPIERYILGSYAVDMAGHGGESFAVSGRVQSRSTDSAVECDGEGNLHLESYSDLSKSPPELRFTW